VPLPLILKRTHARTIKACCAPTGALPIDLVAGAADGIIPPRNVRAHYHAMLAAGLPAVSYKEFGFGHLDFTFGVKDELRAYVLRLLRKPTTAGSTAGRGGARGSADGRASASLSEALSARLTGRDTMAGAWGTPLAGSATPLP
jgi:hypothetical protein